MTTEPNGEVEIQEPQKQEPSGPVQLPDDHPLVKTLAAQKEQIKELKSRSARLDEIEDAQKTELQKAQDRATSAEAELEKLRLEAARASVALSKGLTATQAKRLVGSTLEELEADADELLADLKGQKAAPSSEGQGKVGEPISGPKQITSRDQLKNMSAQEIEEARKDGRLDALLGATK